MATHHNTQLKQYNSHFFKPESKAIRCLQQHWTEENNWVAPPIALIPHILQLIQEQEATATIIAPHWPGCHWMHYITNMLINEPFTIPTTAATFLTEQSTTVAKQHGQTFYMWALQDLYISWGDRPTI
jgi:hypothetical protein